MRNGIVGDCPMRPQGLCILDDAVAPQTRVSIAHPVKTTCASTPRVEGVVLDALRTAPLQIYSQDPRKELARRLLVLSAPRPTLL